MVEIQLPTSTRFILEDWLEYSTGVCIIFLRYCIRIRTVGFSGFQGDDYMTILVRAVQNQNNYSTLLTNCSKGLCLIYYGCGSR
jgi:hypothetical protein